MGKSDEQQLCEHELRDYVATHVSITDVKLTIAFLKTLIEELETLVK